MKLSFARPAQHVSRYALTYYLFEDDKPMVEDVQRADVGAITLILDGSGHYEFMDGRRSPTTPAFMNGPTTTSISFSAWGPLRFFGVSPQPDFWGGISTRDASALADTAVDATLCLPINPAPILEAMRAKSSIEEMAPIIDQWFAEMARPVPPDHVEAIETIRRWLAKDGFPKVSELYAQFGLTERQVTRIANRYFGAPPKALSRKYGALRTASAIVLDDEARLDELSSQFSDHSHMIREVRRVIGQTPRQLRLESKLLMRMTLQPSNFRELLLPD
jgi:AraC-like DNA-binding protein